MLVVHVGGEGFAHEGGTNQTCEEPAREAGGEESLTSGETKFERAGRRRSAGSGKAVTGGDTMTVDPDDASVQGRAPREAP